MKYLVLLGVLGCGGGAQAVIDATVSDLDPTAQGACANLDNNACTANASCQLGMLEDGQSPVRPNECLLLRGVAAIGGDCPSDVAGCRMRADCSPVYKPRLGPTDAPLPGDPIYQACASTAYLLENTVWHLP